MEAKQVVDRVWELVESKRIDRLVEVVDGDCEFKMPGMAFRGVQPLQQLLGAYVQAFPDLRHEAKNVVAQGDSVALELDVTGTHTGPMQMPQGTIPATGKRVVWESCDYVRVRGGKIVSWHVYHDTVPFLAALGLIPA